MAARRVELRIEVTPRTGRVATASTVLRAGITAAPVWVLRTGEVATELSPGRAASPLALSVAQEGSADRAGADPVESEAALASWNL
jgi:hypothetical protein